MRGLYLDKKECFLRDENNISVIGKPYQHLVKVVRIKIGDSVLIFDGHGKIFETVVYNIKNKEADLQVKKIIEKEKSYFIDLAIGIVKRDALESIIKIGVELGFSQIIPLKTEYSQSHFLKRDRVTRLSESALIQSNNCFLPIFREIILIDQIDFTYYDEIFYFTSNFNLRVDQQNKSELANKKLIIVGPEGGLSDEEESYLLEINKINKNIKFINLPTPILRSPTAIAAAMGFIMGSKIF